jgi:type I restriction enzyme S subunit
MNPFEHMQLPLGWTTAAVGSVGNVRYGLGQPPELDDKGVAMIRATNIKRGRISSVGLIRIKRSAIPESRNAFLKEGDVLVVRSGAYTGDVAMVTKPWVDSVAGYDLVLSLGDNFDPSYCAFALRSAEVQSYFKSQSARSAQPHLNRQQLDSTLIPVPPLAEQRKIAGVLGLVQRAVEQQERLIALTTELKKALLHQLFTQGLHGEPQKQAEIGPVPQSWKVVTLASLFEIKHGFAFEGEFFASDGHYILLTPGHFFEAGGFRDQKDKTKFYTGDFPRSYLLTKGDLLVAMTEQKAGLLGSSIVIPESNKYLHNQRLGLIHKLDDSRLDKLFLYHFFNTADVRKHIAMTASGSKVRHTSPGKIRELKIALPSLDEQRRIAETFQAVDAKSELLGRKFAALTALFRTLLHQLMTAQVRVHDLSLPELVARA